MGQYIQADLSKIIEKANGERLSPQRTMSFFKDIYPQNEKDYKKLNIAVTEGIADKIMAGGSVDSIKIDNYIKILSDDYGMNKDLAREIVEIWVDYYTDPTEKAAREIQDKIERLEQENRELKDKIDKLEQEDADCTAILCLIAGNCMDIPRYNILENIFSGKIANFEVSINTPDWEGGDKKIIINSGEKVSGVTFNTIFCDARICNGSGGLDIDIFREKTNFMNKVVKSLGISKKEVLDCFR